jgi:hypothetical protein
MDKFEAAKFLNGTVAKCIGGGVHQADVICILDMIHHDLLRQHFNMLENPSSKVARTRPEVDNGEN